jgi:single stranded DNA-binding protein (ssb)
MNKAIIKGRLGADPETKTFQSGASVVEMRIATDDGYFDKKKNERVERTNWHRVKAWGRLGETMAKYLTKGREVLVSGRIEYTKSEGDGGVSYYTDIVADSFEFCGKGQPPDAPDAPDAPNLDDVPF